MCEYRGNVGIGLRFREGRYRIEFAASLDSRLADTDLGILTLMIR